MSMLPFYTNGRENWCKSMRVLARPRLYLLVHGNCPYLSEWSNFIQYCNIWTHTVGIKKKFTLRSAIRAFTYVLLCAITLRNNGEYRNYEKYFSVVPLGSLSVLFKHWLNFDLVFCMPLNRRWPTYVEISWPMSQLTSTANHTSRWKCSLFLTKILNHAFSLAKWERSWRYKLVATYVGRLRADNERKYPSTIRVSLVSSEES